ncbi:hypothetical protein Nmel_006960 [Mimus melanotis]
MTTTAYLDLFLNSILEPALLKIFLRFILLHQHENILDTLTSRINTPFRLCVVSLAFFRALIGLHCEDAMLQLVLRITLTLESQGKDCILWTKPAQSKGAQGKTKSLTEFDLVAPYGRNWKRIEGEGNVVGNNKLGKPGLENTGRCSSKSVCIVEYGRAVDISYLQYLGKAQEAIMQCMKDCKVWSALYDGVNPDPDTFIHTLAEENSTDVEHPMFRLQQRTPSSYIEESDFQDDVMVYRLCAQKDSQDDDSSKKTSLSVAREHKVQSQIIVNGSLVKTQLEMDLDEHSKRNSSSTRGAIREQINQKTTEIDPQPDLKISSQEADCNLSVKLLSIDGEDFIVQYDRIIKELDPNSASLEEQKLDAPDPVSPAEEDFENFSADTPSAESISSPFGTKEDVSPKHSPRSQSALFTGPFISVVLLKLENMLENSLHVNWLRIGIITQLASYPQLLLRSFLLNTNMMFQTSVHLLYQIEYFASIGKDFPGLLLEAQQYLHFRVDVSDAAEELLTKGNIQHSSNTGKGKNLPEAYLAVLQPFLGQKGKKGLAHPSHPVHVRNTVLADALFPEFLKELAALAQEHSILCYKILGDFEDYY